MGKVVALANHKGGVGKTTSTHALGVALAALSKRVLLVDLDPQASLTYSVGLDPEGVEASVHDSLVKHVPLKEIIKRVRQLFIAPATIDLAGSEVHLLDVPAREHALKRALAPVRGDFDFIFIDLPPSLSLLTITGLSAADEVIIPVVPEALAHRGVGQLLETVSDVRMFANPSLVVRGILVTMFDERTRHAREILEAIRNDYRVPVLEPYVKKSIRFAEAPSLGESIIEYAPSSEGAASYKELAEKLAKGLKG